MATGAVRPKDLFAIHGIAARRIGRGGRGQRAQVCEDLPRLSVLDARVGRHLGARHALFNRLEKTRVGSARRPDLRDIGRADAPRVHAVAVCTARAIKTHPAADGVRVPFERVLCRWVLGGEKVAADHAQHPDREHRARPSHTRFLLQWRVYTTSGGAALGKKNKDVCGRSAMLRPVLRVRCLAYILCHSGPSQG